MQPITSEHADIVFKATVHLCYLDGLSTNELFNTTGKARILRGWKDFYGIAYDGKLASATQEWRDEFNSVPIALSVTTSNAILALDMTYSDPVTRPPSDTEWANSGLATNNPFIASVLCAIDQLPRLGHPDHVSVWRSMGICAHNLAKMIPLARMTPRDQVASVRMLKLLRILVMAALRY